MISIAPKTRHASNHFGSELGKQQRATTIVYLCRVSFVKKVVRVDENVDSSKKGMQAIILGSSSVGSGGRD